MPNWFGKKPKLTPRQVKALTWIMEWEVDLSCERISGGATDKHGSGITRAQAEDEESDLISLLDLLDEHGVKTAGLRREMADLDKIYGSKEKYYA